MSLVIKSQVTVHAQNKRGVHYMYVSPCSSSKPVIVCICLQRVCLCERRHSLRHKCFHRLLNFHIARKNFFHWSILPYCQSGVNKYLKPLKKALVVAGDLLLIQRRFSCPCQSLHGIHQNCFRKILALQTGLKQLHANWKHNFSIYMFIIEKHLLIVFKICLKLLSLNTVK